MDRREKRQVALRFLYDRYEEFGAQPLKIRMPEAAAKTGLSEQDLGMAFQELVDDGLAEGHPRPGTGMHPAEGLVWISAAGRRQMER